MLTGLIQDVRTFQNRKGEMAAFFRLDDGTGYADISISPALFSETRSTLGAKGLVLVRGATGIDDRSGLLTLKADGLWTLEGFRTERLAELNITLPEALDARNAADELKSLLRHFTPGATNVIVNYKNPDGDSLSIRLGEQWRLRPEPELLDSLVNFVGESAIQYGFGNMSKRVHSGNTQAA